MFKVYGASLNSRLMLGTAQYPSPAVLQAAFEASKASVATVSLRRESAAGDGAAFWSIIQSTGARVLPNTAGCHSAREAITTAQMAREVFDTDWIKLEVIGDNDTLQPDLLALVEAATELCREGFKIFPYCTEDLIIGERLLAAGCEVLMPWGAPIGSGLGLNNRHGLRRFREEFRGVPLVIDAGIGVPSHAAEALEMGYDAVLLNTAVAHSGDPVRMARAFALAIEAGRAAHESDPIAPADVGSASTPVIGKAFLT